MSRSEADAVLARQVRAAAGLLLLGLVGLTPWLFGCTTPPWRLVISLGLFAVIGLWAAYGMYHEVGDIVAAGVVTGVGYVHDRACMIVANDASVKAQPLWHAAQLALPFNRSNPRSADLLIAVASPSSHRSNGA